MGRISRKKWREDRVKKLKEKLERQSGGERKRRWMKKLKEKVELESGEIN